MTLLFVYGTLKQNGSANHLITENGGKFISKATTDGRYHLYHRLKLNFPCIIESDTVGKGVQGDIFEIPDKAWGVLDRYECVLAGLFKRQEIELSDGQKAQAYLYGDDDLSESFEELPDGVWR